MRTAVTVVLGLLLGLGCATSGNVPGHNHPADARRDAEGGGAPAAGALAQWHVVVGGAT